MSTFEVKVYKLIIEPMPNADRLELARVGDYVSIVGKGQYKTGDLGAYIPEQSILPEIIIEELGLKGKLSGRAGNRVRAAKLRGTLSQGLIYPVRREWKLGQDVAEELHIIKYEPTLPQHMKGKAVGIDQSITVNYDIENVKKHNRVLQDGEMVAMTEKIHGTFVQFGYVPKRHFKPYLYLGCLTVTSKGQGQRGILLDVYDEGNVYTKIANDKRYNLYSKLICIRAACDAIIGENPIYLCGEIFGPGVQKGFGYGVKEGDIQFRLFDIAWGERSNLQYLDYDLVQEMAKIYDIPTVPELYRGPYSKDKMLEVTSGKETVSGKGLHIREGTVVKPIKERSDSRAGRVILKSVSEAYLLRKGEVTEYQ